MITVFIVLAMLFFIWVETLILLGNGLSRTEKIVSFVCFSVIEFYYVMQLLERFVR
jgi:hypothetical protein